MNKHTIGKSVSITGKGHQGIEVTMTLQPAGENFGIKFKRTDIEGQPLIKADVNNATESEKGTNLKQGKGEIHTVDHILSALYGMNIDNVLIEVDGPEIPTMDSSAYPFVEMIKEAGIVEQEIAKEVFEITQPITYKDENGTEISLMPYGEFEINTLVAKEGQSQYSKYNENDDYAQQIAISQREDSQFARHELLDFVGGLALSGAYIKGKIIAQQPNYKANIEFAKLIKTETQKLRKLKNKPVYDDTIEPLYDIEKIKTTLPHRYPFLLVDKVIELSKTHVVGIKNVTGNENFFQGHFPGNPVFPGVLQMEALAQTGGILALNTVEEPHLWDTYFLKMDNVKFKQMVVPGDTIILKMELLSPIRRGIVHMQGTAYVGDKIVSEGELTAQIVKRS